MRRQSAAGSSLSTLDSRLSSSPRILVCLPTFNESENLQPMIAALLDLGLDLDVLVIDDSSPDGTGELAAQLAAASPRIHVLVRPRRQGLGKAYLDGFRWALERTYELVCEIDCDFSHPPGDLVRMVAAADQADLVLGSRLVPGGGVEGWGPMRHLVSRGGNLYARLLLCLPVHDLTGGFKVFRRSVLETIDLDAVGAAGYAFQIEMTLAAWMAGFRVIEVPFVFTDRRAGRSKMSWGVVAEALARVPALRRARFTPGCRGGSRASRRSP